MWVGLTSISSTASVSASTISSTARAHHSSIILNGGPASSSYHPSSAFEVYNSGSDSPLSAQGDKGNNFRDNAQSFVHRLGNNTAQFKSGFDGAISLQFYFNQHFNGIPVANAFANVALNKAGKVATTTHVLTAAQAADKAAAALGGSALPKAKIALKYLADELVLTYAVHMQTRTDQRVLAYVNAATGEIAAVVN